MNLNIKPFFERKKIIQTRQWQPGILVKTFKHKGETYVRIAFPNRIKYEGHIPITDVAFKDVTGMRRMPSRFEKWFWSLLGIRKKGVFYKINHSKKLK